MSDRNPAITSWAGVELRHLSVLAAVAEERSFRGAAERLGYVQSAVSQRIAQLELAVGVRLVERTRGQRDVHLTPAGATLLRHAERIGAQLSAARTALGELDDDRPSPSLKVGACGGEAARLLPAALGRLIRRSPQTRVHLREAHCDSELFEAVETGVLDAGLAELPLDGGPYQSRRLLSDPLVALVSAGSPLLDSRSGPTLADLASQPFVVDPTWRMFDLVEAELAATGIELDAHYATRSTATAQALVAAGLGVAIAPRIDVDPDHPGTALIDLSDSLPSRTVVCFWSPDCRAEALGPFLDAIEHASLRHRSATAPVAAETVLTSAAV
jgi:DNA-binding transcriptional LysR family regulator